MFELSSKSLDLHAMTEPPEEGKDNLRFRDLFDLWQLRDQVPADAELRAVCIEIFRLRNTHAWPPNVKVYDSWIEPYKEIANDAGVGVTDAHQAAADLREYAASIEALNSNAQ
jgi:hypothetical protein